MFGLTLLVSDPDRYHDVFSNGFARIAMKETVLREVSQYFDEHVMTKLTAAFPADDRFNLLGVGVGEGHHEQHFLKTLGSHFSSIMNVAVDRNERLLESFKINACGSTPDEKSHCDMRWFNGTLQQFFDESPLANCKYNLISAIHSMYHVGDIETIFTRLASTLKDNGVIIVVLSETTLMRETLLRNTWLPASHGTHKEPTEDKVITFMEQRSYTIDVRKINIKWDLTDLFEEKSELGDKLADFFTSVAHFRRTAPAEKLNELMSFWRSFCSEGEDGRLYAPADDLIITAST
ncbi:histamine N-methyltransferase-like [Lytechinus variegatus]|uniref:histamine N-methyltransferase-like n=1 Tax=Lytechinus variegatus TaxID=7654 RepID=UPI001BB235B3|nr:histamine N-methyltransferase-like [Lytechinus variegatus]